MSHNKQPTTTAKAPVIDRYSGPILFEGPASAQILAQEGPHVRRVIRDPGDTLDHLGDTLQRPQIVRIAVRFGAFGQLHLDLSELLSVQLWQAAGPTCAAQAVASRTTPGSTPG